MDNDVWSDQGGKKVIKVCFENDPKKGVSHDEEANNKMYEFFNENKNDKRVKYISLVKPIDGIRGYESKRVLEDYEREDDNGSSRGSVLFSGISNNEELDETISSSHLDTDTSSKNKKNKTLRSFFYKAKHTLKAVSLFHDRGLSHNDLKPKNFLKIKKSEQELLRKGYTKIIEDGKEQFVKKDSSGNITKRAHKNLLVIDDFGLVRNLYEDEAPKVGTSLYMPKNKHSQDNGPVSDFGYLSAGDSFASNGNSNSTKSELHKRDMYALGVSFVEFLFRGCNIGIINKFKSNKISKEIVGELWDDYLSRIYSKDEKERAIKVVELIFKMVDKDPDKRPDYAEALNEIKKLEKAKL